MNTERAFEPSGRPLKKRRFFADDETPSPSIPTPASNSDDLANTTDATMIEAPTTEPVTNAQPTQEDDSGFDTALFASIVGDDISSENMATIRTMAKGNLEAAMNIYLDGSWKTVKPMPARPSPSIRHPLISAKGPTLDHAQTDGRQDGLDNAVKAPAAKPPKHLSMPRRRYIGAFGVEGWATKSGTNLIQFGEAVHIERTKLKAPTKLGRGGKMVVSVRHLQRGDVITRFTNHKGEEIGRLPKETAEWVSPLIDQGVCEFEGTCVFAPDRVRVNDNIYLQLRCYLLKSNFDRAGFADLDDDNRMTGLYELKESSQEKDLRLRQVSMVKLFNEINLHPSTVNATAAANSREGLIKAAELDEAKDKKRETKQAPGQDSPEDSEEEGEELQEDQLDMLYKKAQTFDFDTPEATPASTFVMDLRKYQKQALHWMLSKERDQKSNRELSMHPLWEEYKWPTKDCDNKELPSVEDQDHFYVNPYSGEIGLEFPVQEQNCLGGILADEMGLGKTIEMLSLVHSHRPDPSEFEMTTPQIPGKPRSVKPAPRTTLVVAPMSLLAQWESEAAKASVPGTCKTLVYYGADANVNLQNLCSKNNSDAPNVIITSYGVVLSEYTRVTKAGVEHGLPGSLFSVEFFRVILDEAHTIKNRMSKTARACYEIKAVHRWVLTGTPIVNRLEDLFSLVRFLKVEPWSNFSYWKTFITVPFENRDYIRALNVVQTVLEPLVLRRTKDMKTPDGEALVPLPKRTINIEKIELPKEEREVYDYVFTRAKRTFNDNVEAGTVMKSYTTIFAQLLRLRQTCCHPILIRRSDVVAEEELAAAAHETSSGLADDMDLQDLIDRFEATTKDSGTPEEQDASANFTKVALRQIQTDSSGECPICSEEPMIEPTVTACWHSACRQCLEDYREHQKAKGEAPLCFNCRVPIHSKDLYTVIRHSHNGTPGSSTPSSQPSTPLDTSTPPPPPPPLTRNPSSQTNLSTTTPRISLRRLYPLSPSNFTSAKITALIKSLTSLPPGTKSVIFSQFTSFLDLIGPALIRLRMNYLRFDGSTNQKTRAAILSEFTSPQTSHNILLLSLKAGGVGLNLTAANHCFMMDPWWSFAVESQAIDRVHRMGQMQEVVVTRFIVERSIEERMLKVQERKSRIAGTLGMRAGNGGEGEEDRKKERIEDLRVLFE